jgi:hypothetical protein
VENVGKSAPEKQGKRVPRGAALVVVFLSAALFFTVSGLSFAASRVHLFYPGLTPQFANQLDIETVSIAFFGHDLIMSDTRHNLIYLNLSQPNMILPNAAVKNGPTISLSHGQAVVMAGNSHTAPLPGVVPLPAVTVGINPLGLTESKGLVFIADGAGTIDALNISERERNLYEIPPLGNTGALRGRFTRMIQRTGIHAKSLGLAAPLQLPPGTLSVVAGGGDRYPGDTPIDAFSCRLSPLAIANGGGGKIFIAGETGRISLLNESPAPVTVPVIRKGKTVWISVPTGMIVAVAGIGDGSLEAEAIPHAAVDVTLSPTAIAVHRHHLFIADSGGTIDEINIAHDHLQVAADVGDPNNVRSLDPGEIVVVSGNGNRVAGGGSEPAAQVGIRPKSLAISRDGLLFLADNDQSLGVGRVLAMNVSRHAISLPFSRKIGSEQVSLQPGRMILVAGNSSNSPVVRTLPGNPLAVGIHPVQLAYRDGFLVIGDLLGTIDVLNLRPEDRPVHPLDTAKTVMLPGGSIISLMGAGVGTSVGRKEDIP